MKLIVEQLEVRYPPQREGDGLLAVAGVSFALQQREFVTIVGPSGCGKTTLLRVIAGLTMPSAGSVTIDSERTAARQQAALVFQEHGLFPWMTALDNVAFGLEMQGVGRGERHERAHTWLANLGLAQFASSYPHQLSGGMRQRVGIARAFVCNPDILLMDEPFGALDAQTRLLLQEMLLELWQQQQNLVLYVTHDIEEAIILSDRVLIMSGRPGKIQEEIAIPLPRPRHLSAQQQPVVTELRWHIWEKLESDVRRVFR